MVFLENELVYGRSFEVPVGDIVLPVERHAYCSRRTDVTIVSYSIGVGLSLGELLNSLRVKALTLKSSICGRCVRSTRQRSWKASRAPIGWLLWKKAGQHAPSRPRSSRSAWKMGLMTLMLPLHGYAMRMCPCHMPQISEKLAIVDVPRIVAAVRRTCNR